MSTQRRRTADAVDDDESDVLLPRNRSSSSSNDNTNSNSNSGYNRNHHPLSLRGDMPWRIALLLITAALVWVGIVFQSELNHLTFELQDQQLRVGRLEDTIARQGAVIERFNASVTNADVMTQLATLQDSVAETKQALRKELHAVQDQVTQQLAATLTELSQTVQDAELQITQEVEKVKRDVEQYVITTQDQFSMENSFMVYQLAGTFTLLSCLISMWHMTAHIRKMIQPDVQRKILAILWMCPIYAITSWFSLVFPAAEGYLAIIKDGYEAYVIYQFLSFCIAVLGKGDRGKVVDLLSHRADHLTPPFRLLGFCEICGFCPPPQYPSHRALADAILLQCQIFAMQFVFFRPLTTTAMVVLGKLQYYGAGTGPTDYRSPQFYITIVQNISIFTAFTGLLKFYHAVDQDLAWCRPFAKFLCIKCVVFVTFWQGLALAILAATTDVMGAQDPTEWSKGAQNFLICLEMLLFSIAHFYCFPTEEWEEGYRVKHGGLADSIAIGDFLQDLKLILRSGVEKKKKKSMKKLKKEHPTIPEGDDEDHEEDGHLDDDDDDDDQEDGTSVAETCTSETDALSARSESSGYPRRGSEGNSNDEFEQQQRIAKALEQSLGLAADDPDIAEAKRRLLESKILSPDMFECDGDFDVEALDNYWSKHHHSDPWSTPGNHTKAKAVQRYEDSGDETDTVHSFTPTYGEGKEESPYDPQRGIYSDKAFESHEKAVSETTLLLTPKSPQELRPSIFTKVASLSGSENDDDKKGEINATRSHIQDL